MRTRDFLSIVLLWAINVTPLHAQVNGQDLMRLGVELLGGAAQGPDRDNRRLDAPSNSSQQDENVRSPAVAEIQRRLNALGYPVGTADGETGPRTRQAIANFQRDNGLPPTGLADDRLRSALRVAQPSGSPATTSRDVGNPRPSFDCRAASQATEHAICSSQLLAELDRRLVNIYTAAVASGITHAGAQAEWISRRNRCKSDTACIENAYRERLSILGANNGGLVQAPAVARSNTFTLLEGFDLPYGDYRSGLTDPSLAGIGSQSCQQICAADAQCRGFTYNQRGNVCILKNAVNQRSRFAGAVSGIKNIGSPTGVGGSEEFAKPGILPGPADFVHMALMSDADAYLEQAGATGVAYIRATGTEAQCRELYQVQRGDEFARRDYLAQSAILARQVIASLPARSRRFSISVEAQYTLGQYDFDRQGFPVLTSQNARPPILEAGTVALLQQKRPPSCLSGLGGFDFDSQNFPNFIDPSAEHAAVENIDFLPMPEREARLLRDAGVAKVLLRAAMTVEPRLQGRGPLRGQITAVAAHDPVDGRLIHTWDIDSALPTAAPDEQGTSWTGELMASLIGPILEPNLDRQAFDGAATQYFSRYMQTILAGNLPPQSPLPIEAMRGRQAEVVTALNRDRLRAALRQGSTRVPINVTIDEMISPFFEEGRGIYFNKLENSPQNGGEAPLSSVNLSDRDLPLYRQLSFLRPWRNSRDAGFREFIVAGQPIPISLELDRIVSLEPVAMGIEAAAARGLVGYNSSGRRDNVNVRWDLSVSEVRFEKGAVIISASLRGLSYRWASDNRGIASFAPDTFTTVAALRGQIEAALPARATVANIAPPPAGAPYGAEMMDLLQLRYQPATVNNQIVQRMMITRFAYEASSAKKPPLWGSFFRDITKWPEATEYTNRLAEFRAWSEARAAALPATLTISLPLSETADGKFAPFESRGRHPYDNSCRSSLSRPGKEQSEKDVSAAKICEFLNTAWQLPEPQLFHRSQGGSSERGNNCAADPYCTSMRDARIAMKLPLQSQDFIEIDRLPQLDAAHRRMQGKLAIEIDVKPTGVAVSPVLPESVWGAALKTAFEFDKLQGLNIVRLDDDAAPSTQVLIYKASAVAARLVDLSTGAVVSELVLATISRPPLDKITIADSKLRGLDLLEIRLGMSFDDADKLIREHMSVSKVLTADRKRQLGSISGDLLPYTSGRIYASSANNELIAIFDEPPASPGRVLGIWRILRLPQGSTNAATVKATLVERYGEPRAVQEVSLPMMHKGVAFLWTDYADPGCRVIDFGFQANLWQDENNASWLPPFMPRPLFPILAHPITFGVGTGDKLRQRPLSEFCPPFLGVRYATHDGRNADSPAADELVSWLSDHRSYAKSYYESRTAPVAAPSAQEITGPKIKF
ncbi:peptidoglycan-binding protein [Neorhizobium sp. T25_13]|uniref:peptidoglycan-binding protein n=1 Tax=Neorhizobium sp. T25_13 TaxID=2093830 RepID=UPI00155F0D55|nr:peptidoglycan-binding protein [Neorhizobium sp. T25_13]